MKLFGNKEQSGENGQKTSEEWISAGENYYKKNKFDKAVRCYTEVLKQDPNNFYAWGEKGKANYKLKNHQQALDDLNQALELDSEYIMGYYLRAFPLVELKQYREAIENFETFLKNAGPEYKKELKFTQKNLENLRNYYVNELDEYKKLFPIKTNYDITSSDLKVEGRLKDLMINIYAQKDGLRFNDVDLLNKIKENLFFIQYEQINSIEYEKGVIAGAILLNAADIPISIKGVPHKEGRSFVDRVQERVAQYKSDFIINKSSKFEGYHRKTRSEVEISILDEGLSLKYKEDESEGPGQIFDYGVIENVEFHESLINVHEGVLKGELVVNLKDKSKIGINKVNNTDGRYIEEIVQEKIYKVNSVSREKLKSISTGDETVKPEIDPLDEIEKAKKLLEMSAITEKQFEEIRDSYLKKLI